ncbi:MAG: flavin reductase family protein [candidate division NC10 bacterium]|nr:flavin reductase family protein [candidate division NC10 bacterium]
MKTVHALEVVPAVMQQLQVGAFLTVAAKGRTNVMTIGWALVGILWQKTVMMVAVRNSRHTFGLIEEAESFTVSVPTKDRKKELDLCGTLSGRAVDKFKECKLATRKAQKVSSPVLDIPGYHYECRRLYKSALDPKMMDKALEELYPKKDYHTLYFGEIVACYQTD